MINHPIDPQNVNFLTDLKKVEGYDVVRDKDSGKYRVLFFSNAKGTPLKADCVALLEIGGKQNLQRLVDTINKTLTEAEKIIDL